MAPHATALLFIYTETPLHVGSGAGLGAIDLPIQRERMSGLPIAPGSGIKGALREGFRAESRRDANKETRSLDLFGPEPPSKGQDAREPKHAGALIVTDARLLLFPVRTVYGGWAWATSPMILERLARDLQIAGGERPPWADLRPAGGSTSALLFADKPDIAPENNLILEDTLYTPRYPSKGAEREAGMALVDFLAKALPRARSYDPMRERLPNQLVLLNDDELKQWTTRGTEVTTRVRINEDTGTVAKGALWTEEALPAESLLWSLAHLSSSRKPRDGAALTATDLLGTLAEHLSRRPRTFLGGDRTIGRGLCGLNLSTARAKRAT